MSEARFQVPGLISSVKPLPFSGFNVLFLQFHKALRATGGFAAIPVPNSLQWPETPLLTEFEGQSVFAPPTRELHLTPLFYNVPSKVFRLLLASSGY